MNLRSAGPAGALAWISLAISIGVPPLAGLLELAAVLGSELPA